MTLQVDLTTERVERLCAMDAVPVYVVRALLKERDYWRQNYWERTSEEGRMRAALERIAQSGAEHPWGGPAAFARMTLGEATPEPRDG